jgi:hypothetical protein
VASEVAAAGSGSVQQRQRRRRAAVALRAAVACGYGERGGGGGERQRATKAVAVACGGGVRLFSVTRDGTLRGEMKIYVKYISGHKFAERGGDVLQICVFMTNIHIIGLNIGLQRY